MLTLLIRSISKTFTNELNQEMKQLIQSQSIFVATFILRSCLSILLNFNSWIDFTRDYPGHMGHGFLDAMFPFQFLLFNTVPYLTLELQHHRNYKKPKIENE